MERDAFETTARQSRSFGCHLEPRAHSDKFSNCTFSRVSSQTLINLAYCCLILLGKSIQKIVFGDLRISEQQVSDSRAGSLDDDVRITECSSPQHMKDKFWNFIFYKFIFVFGIVNVQYLHEILLWVSWFSALGFLHLMSQLCKDRFEYVSLLALF